VFCQGKGKTIVLNERVTRKKNIASSGVFEHSGCI